MNEENSKSYQVDDELEREFEDRAGLVEVSNDGNELVPTWVPRGAHEGTEMLRFDRGAEVLRIFPKARRGLSFGNPFDRIIELQVMAPG